MSLADPMTNLPKFRVMEKSPSLHFSFIDAFIKKSYKPSPDHTTSFSTTAVYDRRDSQLSVLPRSPQRKHVSPCSPRSPEKGSHSPGSSCSPSPRTVRKSRFCSQPVHMTKANIAMLAARRKSLGQKNKKTKTKHAEGRRTSNFLELPGGFRSLFF